MFIYSHSMPRRLVRVTPPPSPDPGAGANPGAGARRGALLYLAASLLSQASALLRYVVLARLLGPEQLGFAAALTITAGFFEFVSDTGSDRFLIQDRDGDEAAVQRLVQLVCVGRGVLVCLSLILCALPIARFYGAPSLAGGLAMLALSPLIGGFLHLDIRRAQRHHDFRGEATCMLAADLAGLAGAIGGALITRDFTAVAYGMIARSATLVVCSHLRARRPYRIGWTALHAPRLARFAAPLMLNGLALFVVSQGDRVIIGNQLGVTALGYYSATLLLIFYPSNVISSYVHAMFVPIIAMRRDQIDARNRAIDELGGLTLLLALAMAAGFAVVAPPMIPLLFGARFTQSALLIGIVGLLQATRFLLSWPTTAALAIGRSDVVLFGNLSHVLILPGAALGIWLLGGIVGIVAGLLGAELVVAAAALVLLNRVTGRARLHGATRLVSLALLACVIIGWDLVLAAGHPAAPSLCMMLATLGLLAWLHRREQATIAAATATLRIGMARLSMPPRPASLRRRARARQDAGA